MAGITEQSKLLEETHLFPWGTTVREQKGSSPSCARSGVLKAHWVLLQVSPAKCETWLSPSRERKKTQQLNVFLFSLRIRWN